jgi:CDP-glycerol glycerophosphotransferase
LRRPVKCKIVWQVKKSYSHNFPPSLKIVRYGSIFAIYEEVTARIWIDNCRKQSYVRKRRGQFYIQTWHSGPAEIKKIERDVENNLSPAYVKQAKHDSTMIDLFLSYGNSDKRSEFMRATYWYEGDIFKCGCPRDDIFFTQNFRTRDKVLNHFHLDNDSKLILFAPTFRNNFTASTYNLRFDSILDILSKTEGGKWVFLVRLHPNISEKASMLDFFNNNIINATEYDDMQELLFAANILITDYSDCMFEYGFLKRPIFLYFTDITDYRKERDLYFDIFSLPFPIAQSIDELIKNIRDFNNVDYLQKIDTELQRLDSLNDGKASERIVNRILEEISQ